MLRLNAWKPSQDETRAGSVLVYGAGKNQVPILEACRREGWRVVAVDRDPTAPGADLADRFLCLSLHDHRGIAEETVDEDLIGVVARITDQLGLESSCRLARDRGLVAACPDLFEAATSKVVLADHCQRAGLVTPKRFAVGDPIPFHRGPVILRPDASIRGKAGIYRVKSPEVLRQRLEKTSSLSSNRAVDISAWIDGIDVSILAHLNRGRARRLAIWDEWVAIDGEGAIQGVGCATPSVFERDTVEIDAVLTKLAWAFPNSQSLVALSLRIDESGQPWVIEIHLGIGGDGIAEKLLPEALPGYDAFELLTRIQVGRALGVRVGTSRPRALLRDGEDWRLIEAEDADTLRASCLATLPADWEAPRAMLGEAPL